jgi:alkylation response protein AidB-like acyl-CoA dehydrogenase
MWISAGEHELSENIIHWSRTDPLIAGRGEGLSLFIVPKFSSTTMARRPSK